jgi:hypothetical protein
VCAIRNIKKGGTYGADFKPRTVNREAEDESNQKELWKLSAQIVGVDENAI